MNNDFAEFLAQLTKTNTTLNYFVDFNKVTNNLNKINIKLNQLNYLLGKQDLLLAITDLYNENPTCFNILPILIAVRDNKDLLVLDNNLINSFNYKILDLKIAINNLGLAG